MKESKRQARLRLKRESMDRVQKSIMINEFLKWFIPANFDDDKSKIIIDKAGCWNSNPSELVFKTPKHKL